MLISVLTYYQTPKIHPSQQNYCYIYAPLQTIIITDTPVKGDPFDLLNVISGMSSYITDLIVTEEHKNHKCDYLFFHSCMVKGYRELHETIYSKAY